MNTLIPLFFFCWLLTNNVCFGMKVTGSTKISSIDLTQFISRFAVNKDNLLHVKIKARVDSFYSQDYTANIKALLMNDAEWDMALETDIWSEREKLARFNIPITLKTDGEWTRWESTRVRIINRPQVWYILLADWNREAHFSNPGLGNIEYEMEMTNDGSHFSHEYWGVMPTSILSLVLFSYLLGKTTLKLFKELKKQEEYQTPLLPLFVAIVWEFIQLGLSVINMTVYWYDGEGIWLLFLFTTIFSILAQISIISLFLMIAHGWTLTFGNLSEKNYFKVELWGTFGVHIIIGFLTVIDNGEAHKYHDFEGFQGLLLILLRIGIFIFFLKKVKETMKEIAHKNLPFMKGFIISASIYMLSFPLFWFISYLLNPHMRLKFIHFGNLLVQMVAILILVNQVTKKESIYNKASMRSQGILPNNKFQ